MDWDTGREKKCSKVQHADRIRAVLQFMLTVSTNRTDILRVFKEKFNLADSGIDRYIHAARKTILATRAEDIAFQKAEALSQINHSIFLAFKEKDIRAVLAGIKMKIDMQGLAEPVRMQIKTIETMDNADVVEQLELIAQSKGIGLLELCKREGINLEQLQITQDVS